MDRRDPYPFERFASIRRYVHFNFLRDPQWLVYVADTSGQFNLWRQRIKLTPEGEPYAPYQLTNFVDDAVRVAFPSPIDDRIIFFADHHGTENFQIYRVNAFDDWPQPITEKPKVRHEWGAECFSHDGRYIAYSSNEQNPANMLVYVLDTKENESICLTDTSGWFLARYWSPDNTRLNCVQVVTLTEFAVWVLDLEKREMKRVAQTGEKTRFIAGPWAPDGSGFYVATDLNREYMGLAFYDMVHEKLEWIATPNWDVEALELSRDGKLLVWSVNENGYSRLYGRNLVTGEVRGFNIPRGVIGGLSLSSDGKKLGFLMTTPISPPNLYILEVDSGALIQLTNSLLGNISNDVLVQPEMISYKSFDGLEIPALLYRPRATNGNRLGAVLSIHGGPTAQERPVYGYAGLYQYWVNHGIAVLAPNFRGSTGYGKSFERKIYHDWGGNELRDLEEATKWLLAQDWIDPARLGVFGGSFGGFATLSCVTRLPQYWKAAVDIVGPSNLITFSKSVPPHWRRFMGELVGDPETEQDFLKERSPITYIDNVRADMLVIQGANDPRVVKAESDQMVEKLRSLGRNVEYMVFEDEGHGFTKYTNLIKAWKATAEFLAKKLAE